ncbi:acyl-homoserine-lactone synthase, partial [Sinorhizobium meliloti]
MRILVVSPDLYEHHRGLLTQMHRLRAQVFGSRLGWDVEITADEERDEYDRLGPTYILEIDATDRVADYVRLLPAIGPTMLRQTSPQLLQGCPGKVPGESKCRRRMPRQTAFFRLFSGCRDS